MKVVKRTAMSHKATKFDDPKASSEVAEISAACGCLFVEAAMYAVEAI